MNQRLYLLFFCLFGLYFPLFSQQIPLFTQYRENLTVLNPAAMPSDFFTSGHQFSIGTSLRRQWVGVTNPPTTNVLRMDWVQSDYTGVALTAGGYLLHDQTGVTGFTGAYGHIGGLVTSDAESGGLSMALSAGMVQYRLRASQLQLRDPDDIPQQDRTQFYPDAGVGIFAYKRLENGNLEDDYIYGGVSVPQLMSLAVRFDSEERLQTTRVRHFYGLLGGYHFFGEGAFLEPSVWVKYVENTPLNIDINLRYQMNERFWIGAGSSNRATAHAETGVILGSDLAERKIKIGYGFDYSFSSFGPFVGATHEINLSYSFGKN